MRTSIVMLAVLAGLGSSSYGATPAEARNLSCISGISPGEQHLLRDCEPTPTPMPVIYVLQVLDGDPPPPPIPMKNGEGGKGNGAEGRDHDHGAPAGGDGPNGPSF